MNFKEVEKGFIEEEAQIEAERCLQCKMPLCIKGCPVMVDIKGFIAKIKDKDYDKALAIIKETNNLAGICGRVCPQEKQCEKSCVLGDRAIRIGRLERFSADHGKVKPSPKPANGKKVAVVGSGPAGLTCASDLANLGFQVTIYEALHEPGGVLSYGIPEFRLPKSIVKQEVDAIRELGVKIKLNHVIGKTICLDELDFDAVFIGNGAGLPKFMNIPGENLLNVYSANEYLVRNNLMKAYMFPDYKTPVKKNPEVVVIGGGNVAVDSARVAKRLGANVKLVYRRTRKEMPARAEEVENAMKEGVEIVELCSPVEFIGTKEVSGTMCDVMMLGEPDETGRRRPEPTGKKVTIDCDEVIVAIGQAPNPILVHDLQKLGIKTDGNGTIIVDDDMRTTNPIFFAGGDIINGSATVIRAMGNGRMAAKAIDNFLG